MEKRRKYNDVKFFLVAIAFISAFNYYLTYTNIHFNWFLIFTYTLDTIEGWLAWWIVRSVIVWLDKKLPYSDRPLKRILVQTLLTTIAGLLIIIIATELVSMMIKGRQAPLSFYTFDVFIFIIWFLVINGIYIGLHYYSEWQQSEDQRMAEKTVRANGFMVRQGKQNLLIPFNDILAFYTDEGNSVLLTIQNKNTSRRNRWIKSR